MPISEIYSNDTAPRTVKYFIKQPALIEKALREVSQGEFIAESLFQGGFSADGGTVRYMETPNRFMEDSDSEDLAIAEASEYPELFQNDTEEQANTRKYALASYVTFEAVDRNQLGLLARAMTRMRNTMVKAVDGAVLGMLRNNSKIGHYTAAAAWSSTATTIFDDLFEVVGQINDPKVSGDAYNADTLVVSNTTYTKLQRNKEIRDAMRDSRPSNQGAIEYSGQVGELAGLTILRSPWMFDDIAFVLERGTIGGIADEVPLTLKPVERDEARDVYWLRAKRLTAAFVSDPGAIRIIEGIQG